MEKPERLSKEEIGKLTDYQLAKYAEDHKIDMATAKNREDAEVLIELYHEAADKANGGGKPPTKPRRSKRERVVAGAEVAGSELAAVQQVWARFATNIPFTAQSSGVYEIDDSQREHAKDYEVPDGCYRVVGADWALRFEGGRFVEAMKAVAMKPTDYREVPQAPRVG